MRKGPLSLTALDATLNSCVLKTLSTKNGAGPCCWFAENGRGTGASGFGGKGVYIGSAIDTDSQIVVVHEIVIWKSKTHLQREWSTYILPVGRGLRGLEV